MVIHPSGGLSQADVGRLVAETRARESEDRARKDQEAVVRQLDGLVANTMAPRPGPRGQAHRGRAAAHPRRGREGEEGPRRVLARRAPGGASRRWRRRRASSARPCSGRETAGDVHPSDGLTGRRRGLARRHARVAAEDKVKKDQEAVVRQLDGLVANTMRSVQALEGKLTADEQQRILDAIERAKKPRRFRPRRAQGTPLGNGEGGGHHRPGHAAAVRPRAAPHTPR